MARNYRPGRSAYTNPTASNSPGKARGSPMHFRATAIASTPNSLQKKMKHTSYTWKIAAFRRLIDAKTAFVIRSPTFTCTISSGQVSEWYLSMEYLPQTKLKGNFKVGLYLKGLKGEGRNEIGASATLYLLKSHGGIIESFGHVLRNFRVPESPTIFRRFARNSNGTERRCCEEAASRVSCHEWFNLIPIAKLIDLQDQILPENILNLRVDLKAWESNLPPALFKTDLKPPSVGKIVPLPEPIRYWDIRLGADLVIKCENEEFRVHKNALSAESPVLADMIAEVEQIQKRNSEASQSINIQDVEASIFAIMLEYIYSGTLGSLESIHLNPEIAKKLLQAAADYKITSLNIPVFQKILVGLETFNAAQFAVLAFEYEAPIEMKFLIYKYLRANWTILQQSAEFRLIFKTKPEVFEFVFSSPSVIPK